MKEQVSVEEEKSGKDSEKEACVNTGESKHGNR